MSIPRITNAVINEYGVVAEPDILSGAPAQNKRVFDRLIREKVAPSLNSVINEWEAYRVCEDYNRDADYYPLNRVIYEGVTYECLNPCYAVTPTNTAFWKRVSGTAGGDMKASAYDPTGRKTDIYAYSEGLVSAAKTELRGYTETLAAAVDLDATTGTAAALVLPAPPFPLTAGMRVRFKTHIPLPNLVTPQTLKVGDMAPLPLYMPFRGAATLPITVIEAYYTGTDFRVSFQSKMNSYADTSVPWIPLETYLGTWPSGLNICEINGIVYLQGTASQNLTQSGLVALLPTGMRPKGSVCFASAPGTNGETSVLVTQSGLIQHEYKGTPWRPVICAAFPSEA